jgi:hypothetical protein
MRRLRNVTITLDDEVARWARIKAAEESTSVSRLVGDLLRRTMLQHERFDRARREFQRLGAAVISDGPYPGREDLHDRPRVR